MAKPFNSQLHKDILKLKSCRDDKPAFRELFNRVVMQYKLSPSTVYRELIKDTPGSYIKSAANKSFSKITNIELDRIAELTLERKTPEEICKIMSGICGFQYSAARFGKARQKIMYAASKLNHPGVKVVHHLHDPKLIDGFKVSNVSVIRPLNDKGVKTQMPKFKAFNGDANKLFVQLSAIDPREPDKVYKLAFGGTVHFVSGRVILDCLSHIAASSTAGGKTMFTAAKFDLETLLKKQLDYASRKGYITPLELRHLASIQKDLSKIHEPSGNDTGYSFDDVMIITRHFSPHVNREHVSRIIALNPLLNRQKEMAQNEMVHKEMDIDVMDNDVKDNDEMDNDVKKIPLVMEEEEKQIH